MKLHADASSQNNVFSAYGAGFVEIGRVRYDSSVIVTAQSVECWRPASFADLVEDDFARLLVAQPEVVLLGTGTQLRFPHPRLTRALIEAGIGVEAMDIAGLCRTFNILAAENRRVVAAIVFA